MTKRQRTRGVDAQGKAGGCNPPPEATRWQKGCPSPNPRGRPRTGVFSQAVKSILAEIDPRLQKSGAERLMEQCFRRALQGSYKHLELLLGYAEGRPAQSVDLNASMKILRPEEHVESILAALSRLPVETDEPSPRRLN